MDPKPIIVFLIGTNILTGVAAYSLRAHARKQRELNIQAHNVTGYLVHMLEENGVSISEFDLIALGNMTDVIEVSVKEDEDAS